MANNGSATVNAVPKALATTGDTADDTLQITVGGTHDGTACACPGTANATAGTTSTIPAPPITAVKPHDGRGVHRRPRPPPRLPTPIALLRFDTQIPKT